MELKNKLNINTSSIYNITQNGIADFIDSYIPVEEDTGNSFGAIIFDRKK